MNSDIQTKEKYFHVIIAWKKRTIDLLKLDLYDKNNLQIY